MCWKWHELYLCIVDTDTNPTRQLARKTLLLFDWTNRFVPGLSRVSKERGELNVMWVLFVSQLTSSTLDNWLSPPWSCHTWFTPLYFLSEVTTHSSMDHQETSNFHQPSAAFTIYYLMKYFYVVWLTYQVFMTEKKWPKYHVSPRYTYINLFHTLSRHTFYVKSNVS